MNRAEKLYSVLRDGKAHSRQDIFRRVGFMLTNNGASELRAQGFNVVHTVASVRGERIDFYQLVGASGETPPAAGSSENGTLERGATSGGALLSSEQNSPWEAPPLLQAGTEPTTARSPSPGAGTESGPSKTRPGFSEPSEAGSCTHTPVPGQLNIFGAVAA